ncbi:hypothetical protein NDN08_002540 [Rhodosorus marinus]|uniref:30S ribosomal protein S8, chloroplastic n=1 Tax=Rhodosorus marinus TaxID=101924 RepID=A0AAV8UU11_9RHOD|nr:hypothetical protein NDN08_002540 [Rhodosorus marinus]
MRPPRMGKQMGFDHMSALLSRLNIAGRSGKATIKIPRSLEIQQTINVLLKEGFIRGVTPFGNGMYDHHYYKVHLKFDDKGLPVVKTARRISKPGRSIEVEIKYLPPCMNGLGIFLLKTRKYGVLSDKDARRLQADGELLGLVF